MLIFNKICFRIFYEKLVRGAAPNTLCYRKKINYKQTSNYKMEVTIMERRTRNREIIVRFSDGELQLLKLKMDTVGIKNREAYIRKMALDGFIIKKDYALLKQILHELHKLGTNVNQLARAANTFGDVRAKDIAEVRKGVDEILQQLTSKE